MLTTVTGNPLLSCVVFETSKSVLQDVTDCNPKLEATLAKLGCTAIFGIDTHGLPSSESLEPRYSDGSGIRILLVTSRNFIFCVDLHLISAGVSPAKFGHVWLVLQQTLGITMFWFPDIAGDLINLIII